MLDGGTPKSLMWQVNIARIDLPFLGAHSLISTYSHQCGRSDRCGPVRAETSETDLIWK